MLEHNPQHLIRRWPTIQQALLDDEFLCLLRQLRRRYPQEKAEQLLQSLDIDAESERRAYYSDYEYAAALLGTTTEALDKEEQARLRRTDLPSVRENRTDCQSVLPYALSRLGKLPRVCPDSESCPERCPIQCARCALRCATREDRT